MPSVGTASVDLVVDADQFGRNVTGAVQKSTAGVTGQFDKLGKSGAASFTSGLGGLTKTLGPLAAATAGFDFLKGSMDAAGESLKVTKQTEAALESTGGAANVSAEHVGELADRIKKLSGFEDESVQAGENLLLTFTNIHNEAGEGNDIFDQSTLALADMAARMGGDVPGAAVQLGKALNDPIAGVGALSRVGVQFTDDQKAMIKSLVEGGDIMGAQKIILGELNKEFGGSAKALGDARTPTEKMSQAFGDMQEKVGLALLPAIEKLTPALITVTDVLGKVLPPIMTALGPIIGFVGKHFWLFLGPITALILIFKAVKFAIENVAGVFQWIGEKIGAIASVVGDGIGKVVDFVTGIPDRLWEAVSGAASWLVDTGKNIISGLVAGIEAYVHFLWDFWTGLPGRIWEFLTDAASWLVDTGANIIHGLVHGIVTIAPEIWNFYIGLPGRIWELLSGAGEWLVNTGINIMRGLVRGISDTAGELWGFFEGMPGRISDIASGMWNGIWESFRGALNMIIRAWNNFSLHVDIPEGPFGIGGGSIDINTPNIPYLHQGGIVPGRSGEDVITILRAGELVTPADQVGSGVGSILVTGNNFYNVEPERFGHGLGRAIRDRRYLAGAA